jgi:L-ascorbate metabolism protein UlaG (beta-lactamase superfamily)
MNRFSGRRDTMRYALAVTFSITFGFIAGCDTDGDAETPSGPVMATYLGVSTIHFTDGDTSLLIDGFFTRGASLTMSSGTELDALGEPDPDIVVQSLEQAGIDELDAVLVAHTHLDHVLDAPLVSELTGALLVGSRSTLNVGRGWGLPEDSLLEVSSGEPLRFGRFTVTFVLSSHAPRECPGDPYVSEEILEPVAYPASVFGLVDGGAYSIHISHPRGNALVQASAGHVPGALDDYEADAVFLGVARLGNYDRACQEEYFHEIVESVGGQRVYPIHWDNWLLPLEEQLRPWGNTFDNFDGVMEFLTEKYDAGAMSELSVLEGWQEIELFGVDDPEN